jgi:hypothetical protein
VAAHVDGEYAVSGKTSDDLVPAAGVEAGGVSEKDRRAVSGPFVELEFDAVDGVAREERFAHGGIVEASGVGRQASGVRRPASGVRRVVEWKL